MKNKIILLAVLALLALGIDAQTITHSFRNTSMSDALRYLSTVTRHYVINFAYNDLEDFKVTADVRKQSVPDAIRQIIGRSGQQGAPAARHDLRGVHTEGRP